MTFQKIILIVFFITSFFSCKKQNYIGIQPYEHIEQSTLDSIALALRRNYQANIVILKPRALPKWAFVNIKSPRYRADSLLIDLKENKPDSIKFIIGITSKDISTTKRNADGNIKKPRESYQDWGVFGLGYRPGPSCVVSTFRINQANHKTFTDRLQKISVHEIGHNLGLKHCPTPKCVMQDAAETIKTIDQVDMTLCELCSSKK